MRYVNCYSQCILNRRGGSHELEAIEHLGVGRKKSGGTLQETPYRIPFTHTAPEAVWLSEKSKLYEGVQPVTDDERADAIAKIIEQSQLCPNTEGLSVVLYAAVFYAKMLGLTKEGMIELLRNEIWDEIHIVACLDPAPDTVLS